MTHRRSMSWLLASNLLFFVVQFGSSVLIARLLSPTEMGIYAICMATVWLLQAVQNIGVPTFAMAERDLCARKIGTLLSIAILQGLMLAALFWLLAPYLALMVSEPRVEPALRILCPFALLLPMRGTFDGLLQRYHKFDCVSVVLVVDVVVSAAATIAGAYLGLSYASMSWGAVAGIICSAAVGWWFLRAQIRVPLNLTYWREVWHFGFPLLAIAIVRSVGLRAPDIVLGRLASVAAVGLYNRGSGLVAVINGAILNSVQRLAQPIFVNSFDEGRLATTYLRTLRLVTGIAWPLLAGLTALAAPVVGLLYGPKWLSAAPVVSLLAAAMTIDLALACRSEALIATRDVRRLSSYEITASVASLALFIGGAQYGLVAAAATRILASLLAIIAFQRLLSKTIDLRLRSLLGVWGEGLAIALAAVAPTIMLMAAENWPVEISFGRLIACIGLGAVGWLIAIALFRHPLYVEMTPFLRRLTKLKLYR